MPKFGEGLGTFNAHAVGVEVLGVVVVVEVSFGDLADLLPHGDALQSDHVLLARVGGEEEVGDAQALPLGLTGEVGEAGDFFI